MAANYGILLSWTNTACDYHLKPGPSTAFRVLDENQPPTNTTIILGYNNAKYSFDTKVSPLGSATYRITLYSLQIWLEYLANTTDLLPGATVQLVANPYKDTIADAIVTTLQLLDRGAIGIVGSGFSSATKLTTLLTEAKRVPQCDGASTNPDLSDNTTYPFFFRTIPSDNFQTVAIRDFVLSMGWRRVAIIGQTDAYGTGILKAFQDAVAGSPLKIISVQNAVSQQGIIPDGSYNASSWEAYLDNIRDSNVFVVLVLAIAQQVEGLFEAAAKRGMMSSNKYLREINTTEAVSAFHIKHAACMELLLRGFDRFLKTTPGTSITDLAAGRLNRLFPNPAILFNFPDVFTPTGKGDQKQFVPVAQWDAQTRQVTITRRILYGTD
ncbi:periplasmic binding protein-like I, partial [Entophlyctis helioformis]